MMYTDETPLKQFLKSPSPGTDKENLPIEDDNYHLKFQKKSFKNPHGDIRSSLERECGITPSAENKKLNL